MKSRLFLVSSSVALEHNRRLYSHSPVDCARTKVRVRRHRTLLRSVSLLLILCWTVASILLVSARQGGRSKEEALSRQRIVTALLPEGRAHSR